MKRRSFLGFLSLSAAAGPVAAKAALDNTILTSSGFSGGSAGALVSSATSLESCAPKNITSAQSRKFWNWFKKTGLPEWKLEDIRFDAEHDRNRGLDPDIASLRSASPTWKANTQRNRNIQRRILHATHSVISERERDAFRDLTYKKFGRSLYW